MCETIDCIDFDKIKEADPKWFMGYSDNTNLTFLLATLCDVAAIYGPCAATFGMEPWHSAIKDALDVMTGATAVVSSYDKWERESIKDETNPLVPYNVTEANVMKVFPEGNVNMQGRLLGGCLDCLSNLAGTKYDKVAEFNEKYKEDGVIWFIESCDLSVMDMRRVMWKFDRAVWFKYTKGFIIGRPLRYGEEFMGLDQYSALLGVIEKYNVPVIMDADIGHLPPMMPLVTGSLATVTYENNNLRINMEYK
jgi:muramoyltetrapeptide carboxypeptidase LdcA involved in peptidoglycan recycling